MDNETRVAPMLKNNFYYLVIGMLVLFFISALARPMYSSAQGSNPELNLTAEEKTFLVGKTLRLGVDSARPPFEFIDEKGVYSGISAGFMEACVKRLGVPVVLVPGLNVGAAMKKLKEGEIDVIPKISPEPERAKEILFTKPHATFASVIVTRQDMRSIGGIKDLQSLKVGVIKGLVVEQRMMQDHPQVPLVSLPDVRTALIELSSGKIDAFIENMPIVSYNIDKLKLTNLKVAAQTPYIYDMAFGIRKDWPLLASSLDKALASLSKEEKAAITGRWVTVEYEKGIEWKIFGPIAAALIIVIAFVILWNRRLSRAMRERDRIQKELKAQAEELESRSAVRSQISKISTDLQKTMTFEELAEVFMSQAVPLLGVQHGVLYVLNRDNNLLVPVGGYGRNGNGGDMQRSFAVGQGLVGQCALEKKAITITDTTDAGIFINWGMGQVAPKEILFQPLVQKEAAVGVLELASAGAFHEFSRPLLGELVPALAMNIEILDRNLRTESLLEATREQAERLEEQQAALSEATSKSEEANWALQKQVEELATARRAMMNIMEDLEMAREETEARNLQTRKLLEETSRQADQLREQQDRIKETEIWFRGIIESAPDGMLVIDEKGIITLTNKMVEDIFGYESGELLGVNVDQLVAAAVRGRHQALRESFMQKGVSRQFDQGLNLQGTRKDNSEFPVEIGLSLLPAMGARGRCVCASIRDITERKRIGEELKQQMEELERFTKLTINREERMIELKEEINALLVKAGQEAKYKIVE